MALGSVEELLAVLEKSKLLAPAQFVEAQRLAQQQRDPTLVARSLVRQELVSRWQAAQLLAGRASFFLGRYKLIQLLGRGGMGSVFLAEHVTMNRRVALKIVPRQVGNDRASLDRFFAEARAIAALDHPNIVQAFSVDNECDRYFIVMEYVDGPDLGRLVETEGPLDFEPAADYIRQAADGLAHAHARKMVHCDVKPSNLLINPQGVVKILDLGMAQLRFDEDGSGKMGERILGTVDYQAPEQALGTGDFDHRADIYSLGCTLYYLLTGHPPFPEGTLAQRIVKHQTQEPRSILEDRPDAPAELVEICRRMMAKSPDDRYASATEVSEALVAWGPGAHAAAAPRRVVPLAVTEVTAEEAGNDDWLESLTPVSTAARPKKPAVKPPAPAKAATKKRAQKDNEAADEQKSASALGGMLGLAAFAQWFNTPRRKILGVAVAVAGVSAVTLGVTLLFLWARPKPKEDVEPRAVATDSPEANAATAKNLAAKKENPEEPPSGKKKTKPAVEPEEPEEDDPPEKTPVKKPPRGKSTEKKASKEEPEEPEESEEPVTVKPKTPAKEKPKVEPPKEKPTEPKEKPKPPPKEPPKKPIKLDGLAEEVELPLLGGKNAELPPDQPVSLGTLDLEPDVKVEVELLGGEHAVKGSLKFQLEAVEDNDKEPGWFIGTRANDKPTRIARVWREGGELKFLWLADTKDRANLPLNHVRNCGLLVTCRDQSRLIGLSKPTSVKPLVIDLVSGRSEVRVAREFLPDPAYLRLKVMPLDGSLPKHEMMIQQAKPTEKPHGRGKPSVETVAGDTVPLKSPVAVSLTKEKCPPFGFAITFEPQGQNYAVRMASVWQCMNRTMPLTALAVQRAEMMAASAEGPQAKGAPPGVAEAAKATKAQVAALKELAPTINRKNINFRIIHLVNKPDDAHQYAVTLMESHADPAGGFDLGPGFNDPPAKTKPVRGKGR